MYLRTKLNVRLESMLVANGLGIQISQKNALGNTSTTFIPTCNIEAILINEGFRLFTVKFYLAVIVREEEDRKIVVAFEVRFTKEFSAN
jgi:hypothetical protein